MTNLRQVLPMFLLPLGITMILVLVGLRWRRRALMFAGVAFLWLTSTPLVATLSVRIVEGWAERQPASAAPGADAIVVLSGGRVTAPGRAGISEWRDADRFYGGVELFKAGKAPLVIFTGGWLSRRRDSGLEGDTLFRYARDLGVPADRMAITGRVTTTAEEARAVASLLRANRGAAPMGTAPRVLLVTSAFHMARARRLFERAGLVVIPFPVDFQSSGSDGVTVLSFLPSATALQQTEMAWRELYGRLLYAILG